MQKKKGISLIVLVITIIVMIILAATIILAINNNNVVDKAKDAVSETNYKQVQELAQVAWAEAYIEGARTQEELENAVIEGLKDLDTSKYTITVTETGVAVTESGEITWTQDGTKVTNGTLNLAVGDYVDYVAGVDGYEDENGWRVVGAENGKLLLISTTYVGTLKLSGTDIEDAKNDYVTCISQLNEICKPFGEGAKASSVRSVNADDINKVAKYDPTTFKAEEFSIAYDSLDYGEEVTFYWDGSINPTFKSSTKEGTLNFSNSDGTAITNNFIWYDETNKVWRTATNPSEAGEIVDDTDNTKVATLKSNTYFKEYSEFAEGTAEYELFVKNGEEKLRYWLATQSIGMVKTVEDWLSGYGLFMMYSGKVLGTGIILNSNHTFETFSDASYGDVPVRAVVALEKDVTLSKVTVTSWTITNK